MNINRHNYESFFLLYVDNELSVTERDALELFVQDNADLQEELEMLQQSIVPADEVIFKGKKNLLKQEMISAETEEQLLLYIDKELNATQSKELELVLAADESIATELQILQQTKLLPDNSIVFADKESLCRKERDGVIPFGWWRLAVAAVFIGFGIWGTAIYLNSGSKVVVNETATNNGVQPANVVKEIPATIPPAEKISPIETIVAATLQPIPVQTIIKKTVQPSVRIKQQQVPALQEDNTLATLQKINDKPNNNLPKPYFENLNNTSSNKNTLTIVTPQTQDIKKNIVAVTGKDKKAQPAEPNNNIYSAAFTGNSDENKEDRFTFSDGEPKKSKLSGFLRKAKRVLERNTKMKTGDDNVKVANLEFAIQ